MSRVLEVDGRRRRNEVDAAADTALLYVLRNDLRAYGPKLGCGVGACGACTGAGRRGAQTLTQRLDQL